MQGLVANCVPMPDSLAAAHLTDDAVLGGRLRLLQPRSGHRFGHDAILLAAATAAMAGETAVDLGAGVGTAGLALAARVRETAITLIDSDANLIALARENAARNALADRVVAIELDVAASKETFALAGLTAGGADHVLMNPPFHDPAQRQVSRDMRRRHAHAGPHGTLAKWTAAAAYLLRSGGVMTLIFSADGIGGVLQATGEHFGAITILPIYPKPAACAIRILVQAVKGSRGPLALCPGLLLNGHDGRPTPDAEAILRDAASLPLVRPD
jgi:tRNA1(Val) A37 N6-methylase TrmN6